MITHTVTTFQGKRSRFQIQIQRISGGEGTNVMRLLRGAIYPGHAFAVQCSRDCVSRLAAIQQSKPHTRRLGEGT